MTIVTRKYWASLCGDYAVSDHSDQKVLGVLCGDYAVSDHSDQKALGVLCGDYAVSDHSDQKGFRGRNIKGQNIALNIFRTQQ